MKTFTTFFIASFIVFFSSSLYSQCPDGPSNRYKELAQENQGDLDGSGQAYAQAAMYEIAVCACLSGKLDPRATVDGLKAKAMAAKQFALRHKSDLSFRPWPSQCKFKSSGSAAAGGTNGKMSPYEEYQQRLRNLSNAMSMVNQSRDRAARVSNELKSLMQISSNASPQNIMQQYQQNMQRMDQIESQLRQDITSSNVQGGMNILQDFSSGNNEGGFYGALGMIGKFAEDQEAKKEIANQKEALKKKVQNMMLQAARDMYRNNIEEKEKWLEQAANTLDEKREDYYLSLSNYYGAYASYIDNNFSYSHTRWSKYSKSLPSAPALNSALSSASHSDYAKAAERKYKFFEETKETQLLDGAIRYMNAAINKAPNNVKYYQRLAVMAMSQDPNMAMSSYMAAVELKPSLANSSEFQSLQTAYMEKLWYNYAMFNTGYDPQSENAQYFSKDMISRFYLKPLEFFRQMVDEGIYLMPVNGGFSPIVMMSSGPRYGVIRIDVFNMVMDMLPEMSPKEKQLLHTKMLQQNAINNNHNLLEYLFEEGADVDKKINGKNAIDLALENNSYNVYSLLIARSTQAQKYAKEYENSLISVITKYSNTEDAHEKILLLQSLEDEKIQEEMVMWLVTERLAGSVGGIQNDVYEKLVKENPHLKETYEGLFGQPEEITVAQLISNMPSIKKIKQNFEYQQFIETTFFNRLTQNDAYSGMGGTTSTLIENNLIDFLPNLNPSPWIIRQFTNEEEKELIYFKNKECLLCIQPLSIDYRINKIMEYYSKEDIVGGNYVVDAYREALNSYKKSGRLLWSNDTQEYTLSQVNGLYNMVANNYNLPLANSLNGHITRPIDYPNETYAHIALLTDNFPVFTALAKKYDVSDLKNFSGKSVLDYINQLVKERSDYIRYAAVPGIMEKFNWEQPINGKMPIDLLMENEQLDAILLLSDKGLLKGKVTDMMFTLVDKNMYDKILMLHDKGMIDINAQDPENGWTLAHYYIDYLTDMTMTYGSGLTRYYNPSLTFPVLGEVKEKYNMEIFELVDLTIATNNGNTPYDMMENIFYDAKEHFSYSTKTSTEKKKLKEWKAYLKR